jgi:alkanesulfonate monooxygenase SsuD/methylene tetrahydromethanopterin reductase-like flavin-dependent oxidoreductase (luciferase family)
VAKQVATASVVSGGRVSLAAGVGWMREEYELLGQDFGTRGKRLDEMIPALRALWRGGWVSWSGDYYHVPEMMIEPHPPGPVPILCGGESDAALRRAASLCDGWVGYAYRWDDAVRYVEKLSALRREYGRHNEPFEILLALLEQPTPDLFKRAEDVGITAVMCSPWAGLAEMAAGDHDTLKQDAARYRAAIERFAENIIEKAR